MAWACVQTYGAAERKAVVNLRRQGFEAFSPFFKKPPHTIKKHGAKDAPLFPCYAFVQLDNPVKRWAPINSTFGVIRLLTNRNALDPRPLWIPDDYIARLLGLADDQGDYLPPDTIIRVKRTDSPFYEQIGTVVEIDKQQRLIVLMNLFNRDVKVMFDSADGIEVLAYPDGYKEPAGNVRPDFK